MRVFLWIVGLNVAIFFGGLLVVMYNSHQNSPTFDPVTFDLSDYKPDGSSEKNPENIFYIPARYWVSFPMWSVDFTSKYNKGQADYFSITTDALNFGESDLDQIKLKISIWVQKYPSWGDEYDNVVLSLKGKNHIKIISGVKIFIPSNEELVNGNKTITYQFQGFDNQNVVGFCNDCVPFDESRTVYLNIVRKMNNGVSVQYNLSTNRISDLYYLDKKVVTYLKSLQVPPSSFTRLK
jgi:hypothetical protein